MEDFLEKLNKSFSKAAHKIDELTKVGQLKIKRRRVESDLNVEYRKLGKKVFNFFEGDGKSEISSSVLSENITHIKELITQYLNLNEKIEFIKTEEKDQQEEN